MAFSDASPKGNQSPRLTPAASGGDQQPRLYVRPIPPGRLLARRVAYMVLAFLLVVLIFWLERANLKDHADGVLSLADVIYFTFITITTVGYGDIVPVGQRARLVDALVVTPIRIYVWLLFIGTAYELFWKRLLEDRRMKRLSENLKDHIIVCGYGFSGSSAARLLGATETERGRIVVIDREPDRLEAAAEAGFVGLRGDCTRDQVLQQAGVASAAAILFCIRRDEVAALATLTARNLNAHIRILAMVKDQENVRLLRRAGAQEVITPSRLAGHLMADAVRSRYTTRFVTDLLSGPTGFLRIAERGPRPGEIGKPWREIADALVVAVERDGKIIGFWDPGAARIEAGDLLFAIESNGGSAEGRIEIAPPLRS